MKYWNKQPELRERCWFRVELKSDRILNRNGGITYFIEYLWKSNQLKTTLQQNSSTGKFYCDGNVFWFERSEDATWFRLTYR